MTNPKSSAIDWEHLTDNHAAILEAYFALYQQRDPATIGSGAHAAMRRKPTAKYVMATVLRAPHLRERDSITRRRPSQRSSALPSSRPTPTA